MPQIPVPPDRETAMSDFKEEGSLTEVAILTRAVESVFRRLVRLLMGCMTLTRMQEMIRVVFVEEAEANLKRDQPGKNVSLAKLALMTGLDTRTVAKTRASLERQVPLHRETRFLKEITPECSILDFWCSNPRYLDEGTAEPRVLKLRGEEPSFASLVAEVISTRGVTAKALLDRLEAAGSVAIDRHGQTVSMLDRRYWPEQKDRTAALEIGLATVGNLVQTLTHNLETPNHSAEAFFERANWTNRLNIGSRAAFRQLVRKHLEQAQNGAIEILAEYEEAEPGPDQVTAGVSIFYFEEEPVNTEP
jgi:hypothetical protein